MSDILLGLAIVFGVYITGLVVFTLAAKRSRLVYQYLAEFTVTSDRDRHFNVVMGIVVWPMILFVVLMASVVFAPAWCVMYFFPEEGGE